MNRRTIATIVIASFTGAAAARAADEKPAVALTIYSTARPGAIPPEWYRPVPESMGGSTIIRQIPGYAVVKQERDFDIAAGRSTVRFSDVAALIDPTTVSFTSLTDPAGTQVLDQNYQFDLVSTQKLMERYLDKEISIEQTRGNNTVTLTGTLLSTAGGLVLRDKDGGVTVVNGYSSAGFPSLPGGLITRPTLVWDVNAAKAGKQTVRVSYQTTGITWWADYNVVFTEGKDANSGNLDIGAWVSILNGSGAGYADAKLKLIAGDVHRAPQPEQQVFLGRASMAMSEMAKAPGFEEKAFFEYHLYTLGRPATLPENSTKQIELCPPARGVPCEKVLVYYGLGSGFPGWFGSVMTDRNYGVQSNKKVDIYLQFKNNKEVGMGMPLPSGRIRVSKADPADDTLEFIGEDVIDHTSKDELVRIKLGQAFDVVGERRQVDFKIDTSRKTMDEEIEIKVRNHKDEPVKVIVRESLFRGLQWRITKKSQDFEKVDAHTIHFPVTVPKDGETVVTYTVRYTW
jgi:hypothetical protein